MADIPYTLNGKRVEVPVKKVRPSISAVSVLFVATCFFWGVDADYYQIINGAPILSVNPATLRNPECLTAFSDLGQALRGEVQ